MHQSRQSPAPVARRAGAVVAAVALLVSPAAARAAEHLVQPGVPPQPILDAAAPGDTLVLLPGLHQHGLGRHRAILSVDKPITIDLRAGATLKLADGETKLEATPEITTDQDAGKKLDDLEMGGTFDLLRPAIFTIRIDGEGRAAADGQPARPDTFSWGVFEDVLNPDGSAPVAATGDRFVQAPHTGIPITGDWQELSRGVKVRFGSTTGHNKGSTWFASYDGPEAYGIRIGHGTQPEYIENVRITGRGTIDMNVSRNVQPSFLVKDINACVLVHGRVRDVVIEGITMVDTNRSVMCYGAHTGALLPGGGVGPGESFDAERITIRGTRTLNPTGAAYLLGHPGFRGRLRDVKCNHNYMETAVTCIEPNFNLDGYEVIGNIMKSGGLTIHCWRHSKNGTIADNLRIHDNTGQPVVVFGAPRGWQPPEKPVLRNNHNPLSEALAPAAQR
ncbi:MAG: hypothetical protein ACK48S_08715 [Planctomycetia bacterium]